MTQLILELPHLPALGRDDFLVADSNAEAAALIDGYPGGATGEGTGRAKGFRQITFGGCLGTQGAGADPCRLSAGRVHVDRINGRAGSAD